MATKVAYLMRKTEEGYEPLGDPDRMWFDETGTITDDAYTDLTVLPGEKLVTRLVANADGEIRYAWFHRKDAAIMEIRGQPFF